MGFVYGYRNNNPDEGFVKCPYTGRKNCIKYKTGKARNYHKRLGKEFKETRAEFVPNPQDITVYKTNDATGTKAENKIHAILKIFAKEEDVESLSTYGKKNSKKEIAYLTQKQIDRIWKTLQEDKDLNLVKIPIDSEPSPSAWAIAVLKKLKQNLPNYSKHYFEIGEDLYSPGTGDNIKDRVNNIVDSKKPLTDLLEKDGAKLVWKNNNIGRYLKNTTKKYVPYERDDLKYDLEGGNIDIEPPIYEY